MPVVVSMIGGFTALIGLAALVRPQLLITLIQRWGRTGRYWTAILMRLVIGSFFLLAASSCHFPPVIYAIGGIAVAAALIILCIGQSRLDAFIDWWLSKPPALLRVSALFAMLFGGLLLLGGDGRVWNLIVGS